MTCLAFTFASFSVENCSIITLYKIIITFAYIVDKLSSHYNWCEIGVSGVSQKLEIFYFTLCTTTPLENVNNVFCSTEMMNDIIS